MHRLTLALVLALSFCLYYLAEPVRNPLLGPLSAALLAASLTLVFYLGMKVYAAQWRELSAPSRLVEIFEKAAIPVLSVTWPALLLGSARRAQVAIELEVVDLLVLMLLLTALSDIGQTVRKMVVDDGVLGFKATPKGQQPLRGGFWFVNTPPRSRSDLLPSDLLVAASYLAPVIFIVI